MCQESTSGCSDRDPAFIFKHRSMLVGSYFIFVKYVICKAEIIPLVCLADIIIFAFPETTGAVMGDPEWNIT